MVVHREQQRPNFAGSREAKRSVPNRSENSNLVRGLFAHGMVKPSLCMSWMATFYLRISAIDR